MDKIKAGSRLAWQKTKSGTATTWKGVKTGARKTKEKFERHPKSIDMSYGQHMWKSLKASGFAMWVSFQYLVHACCPFFFTRHCDVAEQQGLTKNDIAMGQMSSEVEYDIDESSLEIDEVDEI